MHEAVGPGVEEDLLAIGSPAGDVFFGRVIGEAPRHASGSGDDIDIAVAIIFPGEGDHRTVGGEVGEGLDSDSGSQAACIATVAAHNPEIVRVIEDNLCLAHRRKTEQERGIGLACCRFRKCRDDGEQQDRKEFVHVGS